MNNITLNIGLNIGNVELNSQLSATLLLVAKLPHTLVTSLEIKEGVWQGVTERTVVFRLVSMNDLAFTKNVIRSLCVGLSQDAIALKYTTKEGVTTETVVCKDEKEAIEFSNDFFID